MTVINKESEKAYEIYEIGEDYVILINEEGEKKKITKVDFVRNYRGRK